VALFGSARAVLGLKDFKFDISAYLCKYADMRTSIDFPDPLFRHLKTCAALQGSSLRDVVLALIERGLAAPVDSPIAASLPSIRLGAPMALGADQLSNAQLSALLDE
jgi:hypothetical protein